MAKLIGLAFAAPILAANAATDGPVVDLGAVDATASTDLMVVLKPRDKTALQAFVASTIDPSSANYRRFLTPEQFRARFGRTDAEVAQVRAALQAQGLTVSKVYGNNLVLAVSGRNDAIGRAFSTKLHRYSHGEQDYQAPASAAVIPAALGGFVDTVAGLSTAPLHHPHLRRAAHERAAGAAQPLASTMPTPGVPSQYTVKDLAQQVNIQPLYDRGIDGTGTTVGIMTFAKFTTTDATTYWSSVGDINSNASRITVTAATTGKISSSGADETTLDVEQSGGIARQANVIVYEAANSDAGEIALYTKAAAADKADVLSISWGLYEVDESSSLRNSVDTLILQLAAQGTPVISAAGDAGAYDLNDSSQPYPNYSATLSVDYPASNPNVLAAGGLTLPATFTLKYGSVTVPAKRPWAWDYFRTYDVTNYGQATFLAEDYPTGGGGGVSVLYAVPDYQQGLPGVQVSAMGQQLICLTSPTKASGADTCTPGTVINSLQGGFAGRNLPDVSLNADPETGYSLYYGSSWSSGGGGTSFVAPQLAGIFALITQQKGSRLGLLQPQLYQLYKTYGYGAGSPFRAITSGTNWYYRAAAAYNPASGLGEIDVDLLSQQLAPLAAPTSSNLKRR